MTAPDYETARRRKLDLLIYKVQLMAEALSEDDCYMDEARTAKGALEALREYQRLQELKTI